jgi:protein-tyrosine-phosphatase/predicted ATP-grasp superfamily ATP-dependent carboligase
MSSKSPGKAKVLVLGDDTRSFLTIVRSLARQGLEVHVCPFNFRAPALRSRYISYIHWLPYYLNDGAEWIGTLKTLLARHNFSLIIPCDERALLPLSWHSFEINKFSRVAIPDSNSIKTFFDKNNTRLLANSLGIPVAIGRCILPGDTAEDLVAEAGLPMAIKPTASYTTNRLYSRNKVCIATTKAEVASAISDVDNQPHLFEGFFSGSGVGVSVLVHDGRILQAFEHHRIHELQGASHYRVSATLSPPLLDAVRKLMEAMQYTGVAMTEFRVNADTGAWILLEINARPWGSLPLPVALGVNFPFLWYQLLVEGVEAPWNSYQVGIFGRNFLPDLAFLRTHLRALTNHPLEVCKFLTKAAIEYLRVFVGQEVYDVFVRDDPAPAWHELLSILEDTWTLFPLSAPFGGRHRDLRIARRSLVRGECQIAIVCQGNVCRSPFAAALLIRTLEKMEISKLRVNSYGNIPREGAHSPTTACDAAKSFGVSLLEHRSTYFSRDAAERATIVIVFDETNRRWIQDRYPRLKAPIVMLGSFGSSYHSIADPDGGDLRCFMATYKIIHDSISGLAAEIRRLRND